MTTYNDTGIEAPIVFNKLTKTQLDNASSLDPTEIYLVDKQFIGNKLLKTDTNGDIVEGELNSSDVVNGLGYTPADDSNTMHLSGNESATGKKTFSDILVANGDDTYYINLKATNLANNNTTPSVNALREFRISANDNSIIGGYRANVTTSGKTQNRIYARRYIDGGNKEAYITLEVDSNGVGTAVTMQPTQDTTSSSQIDTVGARNTKLQNYQTTITGAATTITSSDLTASKALVSDANGKVAVSTVTDTELGYLSGVTSAIQTQLDDKSSGMIFRTWSA